ncbi:flavodoxin family protein [Paraburkholderia dipogonis]|uniref:flavodoxin family protein n=1 Tax=Paraburkholderia dipogonis TaxID=1211383 RepID=UPI0035E948E1
MVLVLLGAFSVLLSVTWIESRQAHQPRKGSFQTPVTDAPTSRTVVVYFSRSGNTALAASHVARRLGARLFTLQATDYRLGLFGLIRALRHASVIKREPAALPDITPSTIDLTPFRAVWLGSPVWLYSPAPPIWAFVEHNRFDGQHVVLFNTYNSHFGDDQIAAFKAKVMARGAASFEHRHVLRGRMTRQLAPDEMLRAIDDQWSVSSESK